MKMTKAIILSSVVSAFLFISSCDRGRKDENVLYYDSNLGSVVKINDSTLVVFKRDGLSHSRSEVIHLKK